MKIIFEGTRPSKINVKGTIYQKRVFCHTLAIFWAIWPKNFSGPKTTIWTLFRPRKQLFAIFWPFFDQFGRKIFLGQKPLFGPFLGPEYNFLLYFGHFSTNLAKKNCRPQTTISTLFRPRNQLFTVFWPFFDKFGRKNFLSQKPLFGPFLGPENSMF